MPFGFAKKVNKIEERKKITMMLTALHKDRQNAFVGVPPLPMKTKTLDEECVRIVLRFLNVEKKGCIEVLFGSFSLMAQVMPELRRIPGDIDIQLRVGKQEAIRIVNELFARLEKLDKTLRINPEKPAIIETNKNGKWERAVDIHYMGEPPEDVLSPLAPLNFKKERTQEQKLMDALDVYIVSKTLLESAKRYNADESIIGQWGKLLKRYVELWEDEIDFDKLEVKK
jgi:hypothetical protein